MLRNMSPVQDGLRKCWIDGGPKGLRICFHSECSPSARLERETQGAGGNCQLTDETVKHQRVRMCAMRADSVPVLILKAAPLSERGSVNWGYTYLHTQQIKKKNSEHNTNLMDGNQLLNLPHMMFHQRHITSCRYSTSTILVILIRVQTSLDWWRTFTEKHLLYSEASGNLIFFFLTTLKKLCHDL